MTRFHRCLCFAVASFALVCAPTVPSHAAGAAPAEPAAAESPRPDAPPPPVVQMRTTDYAFHAPPEVASGWTTFRMTNEGEEPHFLVFWRLPEGQTFDSYVTEVFDPFMDLFGAYKAGELGRDEMLTRLGEALPAWLDLVRMGQGGPGFVSPGRTAQTTVDLPPGDYVMECYMVDAEGNVHNQLGMFRPLIVTEESTGARPPEADAELTLTNTGIAVEGELGRGRQTVRVTVAEAPEGLLGHDVHLARLDEDTDLGRLVEWMDWIDGLTPPAPAEFLGGAEQVPPGETSYITVDLEPGRYAWISEGYAGQGLIREFRVE